MEDIIIRYVNMEHTVPAVTQIDSNGDYNIYINARLGYHRQQEAKEHELRHIAGDHFYRNSSVALDEAEADEKSLSAAPEPKTKQKFPISPNTPSYLYHLAQWADVSQEYLIKALGINKYDYNIYQFNNDKCPVYIRKAVEILIDKKLERRK